MSVRHVMIATTFLLTLLAPVPSGAQVPDEFTNLQLLDPGISKHELISTMKSWTRGLGVRCSHCHVGPDNLQGMDFASDEKPEKQTARRMLEMSRMINREALKDLPTVLAEDRDRAQTVSCFTCHRGQPRPPRGLVLVLWASYEDGGLDAASARYREMRAEHFGRGRYDFGTGLAEFATRLMESGHPEDAISVVQVGLEFEPDSADLYATLGLAQLSAERLEAADESFQRALSLEPGNRTARWGLSRLEARRAESADEDESH